MKRKSIAFLIVTIFISTSVLGHGGETDPTKIGVLNEQSFNYILDTFNSNIQENQFVIPQINRTLELMEGDKFVLTVINNTVSQDPFTEDFWITSSITINGNTATQIVQFVGENSLFSFVDWETIEHAKGEELEGSRLFYENRGGKYNYDIWLDEKEYGFIFELDISDEAGQAVQKQIQVYDVLYGSMLYYYNSYQDTVGDTSRIEEFVLRNSEYEYKSKTDDNPFLEVSIAIVAITSVVVYSKRKKFES